MILELLFKLIFGLFGVLLGLIPDIDIDFSLEFLGWLPNVFKYVDMFISVRMLLMIFAIVILRDNYTFFKNLFFTIIRRIPFIG